MILFLLSVSLKEKQGPYFTNSKYDPNYVYLISSLNLSQFEGVEHIDHPGTPVQVIGAIVIRIQYYFAGQDADISRDVLMNPELYLDKINIALTLLNCIGLFILGIVSYKVYQNIITSILLQLMPFTSLTIISLLTYVRPDNFLFFVICIFIAAVIKFANEIEMKSETEERYLIILGIITGLGIASKLTFLPMIFIPLMLFRGVKLKLLFMLSVFISFIVFVLPAISLDNIEYFSQWINNLFLYNKKYGKGEPTIIDPYNALSKVKTIFKREEFFKIAYISIFISLLICMIPVFKNVFNRIKSLFSGNKLKTNKLPDNYFNEKLLGLTSGIFLAMTTQIIITAKHFAEHYISPSCTISVFALFVSVSVISGIAGNKYKNMIQNSICIILIIVISIYVYRNVRSYKNWIIKITEETNKMLNYVEMETNNSVKISAIHFPSKEFGLFLGTLYAGSQENKYREILNSEYPDAIFYFRGKCYSFNNDSSFAVEKIKSADEIKFLCLEEDYVNQFVLLLKNDYGIKDASFEKIFTNKNNERVYVVKIKP